MSMLVRARNIGLFITINSLLIELNFPAGNFLKLQCNLFTCPDSTLRIVLMYMVVMLPTDDCCMIASFRSFTNIHINHLTIV